MHELLGQVQPEGGAELLHALRILKAQLSDKETGTEVLSNLFELKPSLFGVSVNLNEAFKRILAWDRQ